MAGISQSLFHFAYASKNSNDRNRDEDYFNSRKNNNSVHLRKKNYNEVYEQNKKNGEMKRNLLNMIFLLLIAL